jgi:hypothetical protein
MIAEDERRRLANVQDSGTGFHTIPRRRLAVVPASGLPGF